MEGLGLDTQCLSFTLPRHILPYSLTARKTKRLFAKKCRCLQSGAVVFIHTTSQKLVAHRCGGDQSICEKRVFPPMENLMSYCERISFEWEVGSIVLMFTSDTLR